MNNFRKIFILFSIGLIFQGCHFYKTAKLLKSGEVSITDFNQEIPFTFSNNTILLDVVIEGKTYNFVFDTGAEITAIGEHIKDNFSYKNVTKAKVSATEKGSSKKLEFIELPTLTIAGIGFNRTGALLADMSHFNERFGCNSIDGILGNSFMRKAAWQIDYANQLIRFSNDATKFDISDSATALTMNAGKIRNVSLNLSIDGVDAKFTFDTGSSGSLDADTTLMASILAKNPDLQFTKAHGVLATNLYGNIIGETFEALSKSIKLEGLEMNQQIISFRANAKSLMGNDLFKHYTLTVDWERDKLYLDPIEKFKPDTLKAYEVKFRPNFKSLKMEILSFYNDHTLSEELTVNAEIIKINGTDVSSFTLEELCSYWEAEKELMVNYEFIDVVVLDKGVTKELRLKNKVLLPKK